MKRLKVAIIGMGYIGASHIDAVRRIPQCELYAVSDTNAELARQKAELYGVPRCYTSYEELLADDQIDVVHNCTPNHLHTMINKAILRSGKHLFTEKPLAQNHGEALELLQVAREHPHLRAGVNFNYRLNPMIQEMRQRITQGQIGEVFAVSGCYLQDWLLYDTDYSWRLEPEIAGMSCCIADIGSHWMDAVQHVTGLRITEVMADIRTVHQRRKKPLAQTETFSTGRDVDFEWMDVQNEEYASVLFHLSNGAAGAFTVSEVSAGHGCYFQIEVSGAKESLMWNQEQNDRLWVGRRNADNSLIIRDPACLSEGASSHTALAKGHPEGWNDAFLGNIRAFYRHVSEGEGANAPYATLEEAAEIVRFTEACIHSAKSRSWVTL